MAQSLSTEAYRKAIASIWPVQRTETLNLILSIGFVVAVVLVAVYGFNVGGWGLLWLLPLVIGVTAPLFKAAWIVTLEDRFSSWIGRAREKAAPKTGAFHKYCYRPYLGGLWGMKGWTERISDQYLRVGVRLAVYLYFTLVATSVFLFALYVIVGVMIAILVLIFILWILGQALSESSGKGYAPPLAGFKRGRVVKEGFFSDEELYRVDQQGRIKKPGFLFDEPTGYRVDEEGNLYKEGFLFDQKLHEIREDGTIVDVTGVFPTDTGYRIGDDGKIYKKGLLFDEDTQIRLKRDE
jgi:hypothetical protein